MTPSTGHLHLPAYFAVHEIVSKYIEGIHTGDVQLLKSIFDDNARVHGHIMGNFINGPIDVFLDTVAASPSPASSGEPFRATIIGIHVNGSVAHATVAEESYCGLNFMDHFHLLQTDAGWVIVDKIFCHEPPTEK